VHDRVVGVQEGRILFLKLLYQKHGTVSLRNNMIRISPTRIFTCYCLSATCSHKLADIDKAVFTYSGHKITESLGNVTVRGEKRWKE
jgi:hypothetical protein